MNIKGKVAVVTGSSSGIGAATALLLGAEGARVVVNSRKNTEGGESVVSKITKTGGDAFHVQCDVSNPRGAKDLIVMADKKYGPLDILVNCAGEYRSNNIHDYEAWNYEINNILLSCVYTSSEFLKAKSSGLRKIVNISSMYGLLNSGQPEALGYSASKAAMNSLTINLAKSFGKDVLVNAVAPGWTISPAWGKITKDLENEIAKRSKISRFVTAEEIAESVIYLLKNDAITGQIITVDGGATLKDMF